MIRTVPAGTHVFRTYQPHGDKDGCHPRTKRQPTTQFDHHAMANGHGNVLRQFDERIDYSQYRIREPSATTPPQVGQGLCEFDRVGLVCFEHYVMEGFTNPSSGPGIPHSPGGLLQLTGLVHGSKHQPGSRSSFSQALLVEHIAHTSGKTLSSALPGWLPLRRRPAGRPVSVAPRLPGPLHRSLYGSIDLLITLQLRAGILPVAVWWI